jgi:hypothetical protein
MDRLHAESLARLDELRRSVCGTQPVG